jgi:hypothetical protein
MLVAELNVRLLAVSVPSVPDEIVVTEVIALRSKEVTLVV